MNRTFTRHVLSLAVAALGLVDLGSALLSRPPERLLALRHLVPTDVLDTSRTFTLLAGTLLLLTANGLRRGKRRAFATALFLAAVSVPVNMLKAFDFEEATVAAGLMFVLGMNGGAFTVKSREFTFRGMAAPLFAFAFAFVAYAVGGCWLMEVLFSPRQASLHHAIGEAIYQTFGAGAPVLEVERQHQLVRWYLGSISVVGITVLLGFAAAVLRPARHLRRHQADATRVRELARVYGDSTLSAFAIGDDVDYFFSANGRAVIAYRFESDVLLVIGDPIGPGEEIPALLEAFERFCGEHDWVFGFYQVRPEHLRWYRQRGWNVVHIGEDPVLRAERFTLEGSALGNVRRQVRKLEKAGLVVRHFVPGTNPFDPAHDPDRLLDQLRAISNEWVRGKTGGEKGFCMGRFDPEELRNTWLAVAWNPAAKRVEAFCTWTPIWARRGWAIDLMRRHHDAPTGAMELLVVNSVFHARERGDSLLSLSLSALVKVAAPRAEDSEPMVTEDPARTFLIQRLSRFYDFQGLFRWKRKFNPEFEDRYLIYPNTLALPRIALALVRAQSPGGLWSYLRREDEAPRGTPPAVLPADTATGDAA
jgi:phosphatidylglycerol lysyltransferase